ncbi:HNH endonuclease [Mycetocola tolaasinivorans]|uniref:HNH endonuclease n=1 Tax=Mycetocola tolaasinivorans TaxID=76635 RepID=A0A3L6ZWT4_9MICO|nr:HNH endonuclease [Mycetocola tolaasinivorans]RLP72224.1 HNH endonuclease [Mycetocola tolaasinivorans]
MSISVTTRKSLWARSHNECAYPTCLQELTIDGEGSELGRAGARIIGEEAHIRGQSAEGPRYDPDYAAVDGLENLMLMCPTHHSIIDAKAGADYSVETLLRMKADHEQQQHQRAKLQSALNAYLGDRFASENTVQFQQAELRGPTIESMFVDVPVGSQRDGSPLARLLEQISKEAPGDTNEIERSTGYVVTGATQALLHSEWAGNAILVGGPGQGKSTLLQYICQFHRARRLNETTYSAGQSVPSHSESTVRFPIRIDLRRYAQWARQSTSDKKQKKLRNAEHGDSGWLNLENYLVDHIASRIGLHSFSAKDLVVLLATEPVLLALDGLDEVANLETRARVVEEIIRMHGRLKADAADLVILVATRPGSSLRPLTSSGAFPVLHLQRLTEGLRLQYLRQWVEVAQISPEAASRLQSTFMDSQHVPHINELASYPMQLAILLHLLQRRQMLPQQRTELYGEYLKTFLDREQTEDKEPLLKAQRRVVEDTHAYLGWYLQSKAEEGRSAGSITRRELRDLLRNYLAGQPEEQQLADDLYSALTDRVLCLVEREDAFEFEVQSLREYFAALHLYDNLSPRGEGNSRDDGLNALLERPYWANTCRFFIGMLAKGEIRALIGNFFTVDKKVAPRPLLRSMAATLLNDRVYDGLTNTEIQEVVDFVFEGPGIILAEDGAIDSASGPLRFGERAGRAQAITHLKLRLENNKDVEVRRAAAASLLAHSNPSDNITSWWWEKYEPTANWFDVAARLRAFTALRGERISKLRAAIKTHDEPNQWTAELLLLGGYSGSDVDTTELIRGDLNEGCFISARGSDTELTSLIQSANTVLSDNQMPPQESDIGPRSPFAILASEVAGSIPTVTAASSSTEWEQYLGSIAKVWGKGWILGRAVAKAPKSIDLSIVSVHASSPELKEAASVEASYREHRNDPGWWAVQLSVSEGPDLMLCIISVLEKASTATIMSVASGFNDAAHKLTPKQFRAIESALRQDGSSLRVPTLDLQDAFRLHRVEFSGRALWLIWQLASEATRSRMPSYLEAELSDLFLAGPSDGRPVVLAAHTTRKLKVESFRNARRSLPGEGWADPSQITSMTIKVATCVLESPGMWPAELVLAAIERLSMQAASRVPSLAAIAAKHRWFYSG